jgi:hypothetical protein
MPAAHSDAAAAADMQRDNAASNSAAAAAAAAPAARAEVQTPDGAAAQADCPSSMTTFTNDDVPADEVATHGPGPAPTTTFTHDDYLVSKRCRMAGVHLPRNQKLQSPY